MLLLPISSVDTFSSSDLRVVSFRVIRPSSPGSGFSIISLFTLALLDPGFKFLIHLALSILFPIMIIACGLDSSLELTLANISLDYYG